MKTHHQSPVYFFIFTAFFCIQYLKAISQHSSKADSILNSQSIDAFLDPNSKGIGLIKEEKYEEANQFLSSEIKKNESDINAYFNRGVVRWKMNDAAEACRDWSAVLALGDTATFKLLDKNCHGTMIIEDDTLHSAQYRKMFSKDKKDAKSLSASSNAITIADEMPEFPGGTGALIAFFDKNIKHPDRSEGRVYVNFIISRKGKILFPYVTRGINKACNEEALRVIRKMPLWKPGKQKGKPALVRYNLPVTFSQR